MLRWPAYLQKKLPRWTRALGYALAALAFAACSDPGPLNGLAKGEVGRVVRVIDGDALVLDTGLVVRLAGIEAPSPERRGRRGQPYADASARVLEDLAMGREVRLYYPGLTRDRYDRALAYVETADALGPKLWLNRELVRRGSARVRVYPDTSARAELLLAAEQEARASAAGLWGETYYRIRSAGDLPETFIGFAIVRVESLRPAELAVDQDYAACQFRDGIAPFQVRIAHSAADLCADLTGPLIARGFVRDAEIEITHRLNLQTLPN